jgi:Major Facilitator Superfamily
MACYSIAAAISLPIQGRLIDRIGQPRVIVPATAVNIAGFGGLIALAHSGGSAGAMAVVATIAGLGTLATGSAMRTLWSELVPDPGLRQAAFALDAVGIDVAFIVGPLIAAAVIAIASPTVSLSTCMLLTAIGSGVFVSSVASRRWRGAPAHERRTGPLRSASVLVLMGAAFGVGVAVGAAELAITAFASHHGAPELGGALIAVQALASMVGGLWFGARAWRSAAGQRLWSVSLAFAITMLPLIAIPSFAAAFPLMALSGVALAPTISVIYLLLDSLAPTGTAAEATGWILTAIVGGAALGNAAAGIAVTEASPHAGLAVAAAGGGLTLLAAAIGRRSLRATPTHLPAPEIAR